jgi:hypothetical protein
MGLDPVEKAILNGMEMLDDPRRFYPPTREAARPVAIRLSQGTSWATRRRRYFNSAFSFPSKSRVQNALASLDTSTAIRNVRLRINHPPIVTGDYPGAASDHRRSALWRTVNVSRGVSGVTLRAAATRSRRVHSDQAFSRRPQPATPLAAFLFASQRAILPCGWGL